MNKNKFITGKKAVALLSAIGVTATLLSPLALNTKVFANDETPQIASRTPGDARSTSDGIIDFNDYKNDMNALQNAILSSIGEDGYRASIINIPEGTTLDFSKLKNNEDIFYLDLYVNGDKNTASYHFYVGIDYLKNNTLYFPKLSEIVNTQKDYAKGLFAENVDIITIDPNAFTDIKYDVTLGISTKALAEYGLTDHCYQYRLSENGLMYFGSLTYYDSSSLFFKGDELTILSNLNPDGSSENSYDGHFYMTFDANDSENLADIFAERLQEYPELTTYSYSIYMPKKDELISKDLVNAIQKNNLKFEIPIYDGNSVEKYTLSFDTITEVKEFNPYMEFKKVSYGEQLAFEFDFAHSGTLPGPMTVRMYVGPEYNTQTAYLYYKNAEGKLEKQASNAKVERGYAEFVIDHCSTYVLSLEELTGDNVIAQPSTPQDQNSNTGNVENTDTNTNVDVDTNKPETNTTTPSTNTTTQDTTKEDTKVNLTDTISPSTGDTTKTTVLLSTMAIATVALIGMVVYKKRNLKA